MAELTKCRGCHKAVRIVATERGRQMPVDPDPTGHSTGTERTGAGAVDKVQGIAWPPVRAGAA